jgi:hypothetical protein
MLVIRRLVMRWLHLCLLIILLPLFSASSSQAQQDYTGIWAGTTSLASTDTISGSV